MKQYRDQSHELLWCTESTTGILLLWFAVFVLGSELQCIETAAAAFPTRTEGRN